MLITGDSGCGKTKMALFALAGVQREGKVAAYLDVDSCFNPEYAASLGVDCEALLYSNEMEADRVFQVMLAWIRTKKVHLIVVDAMTSMGIPLGQPLRGQYAKMLEEAQGAGVVLLLLSRAKEV